MCGLNNPSGRESGYRGRRVTKKKTCLTSLKGKLSRILDVFLESTMNHRQLTAIIEREADGYVSLRPELDIASQGSSVQEAKSNLKEALELFFETASPHEINARLHDEIYITRLEVAVG